MGNNGKIFLAIVFVVFVLSGVLIYSANRSNKDNTKSADAAVVNQNGNSAQTENPDKDLTPAYIEKLAKFMTEKGMVMYGAYWCPHCQEQKKEFGDALQYIDYVECDAQGPNANPDECTAQGIKGYPTWIYQGQQYSGAKSLSDLAKIVGFTDQTTDSTPSSAQ